MPLDKNDRGANVMILVSFFTPLAILSTTIRVTARAYGRQLGWDDLVIVLAVVFSVISWPFNILAVRSGYGRHIAYLSGSQIQGVLKWLFYIQFMLYITLPLAKMSVCFFILRIKNRGWLRWFLWGMMLGLIVTNLLPLIILCAQCHPIRASWDRKAGTCWKVSIYTAAAWVGVGFSIFSDLACTLLPIIVLWDVKIKKHMKYLISALMGLGLVATSCGAVRAYTSSQGSGRPDVTYDLAIITEWAILEQHFAILGTNLALSRYIWHFFRGKCGSKDGKSGETIALRNRREYTYIAGRKANKEISYDSLAPLEAAAIRATTDIEVEEHS